MRKRDREWGRREKERISEVGVSIRVAGLGQKLRLRYGLEVGSHGLERETMLSRISDQPTNISFFTYVGPPSSKVSGSRNNFTTARVWRSTRSCFEKRVRIDREKYEMEVAMTSHCDLSQNLFHSIHSFLLSLSLSFLLSSFSSFFPLSFFLLRFSRQFDHRSRDYRLKLRSQWLSRRAGRTRDRAIATPPTLLCFSSSCTPLLYTSFSFHAATFTRGCDFYGDSIDLSVLPSLVGNGRRCSSATVLVHRRLRR